jgi:hypothetical protein
MEIQQNDVAMKIARHPHSLPEISGLSYEFDFGMFLQQTSNHLPHNNGIIGQENFYRHAAPH